MRLSPFLGWLALGTGIVLVAAGVCTVDVWRPWLPLGQPAAAPEEPGHTHSHGHADQVELSPQAQKNLRLVVRPLQVGSYWRTLAVPGTVVERPGRSDHGVTTPLVGVVKEINAVPGDAVHPGEALVTLRLASDALQTSQTELYKNRSELQSVEELRRKLEPSVRSGAVAETRLLELDQQQRRLGAVVLAYRQDLAARGLRPDQIDDVAKGKFLTEIVVRVPVSETPAPVEPLYEIEELKVQLGEQVQAGQVLCTLAHHQALYIEGRAFRQEMPLVEQAARQGWVVRAEFAGDDPQDWLAARPELALAVLGPLLNPAVAVPVYPPELFSQIRFLENRIDPGSQTVPFYLPLVNQYREHQGAKTYRIWRFRPGQRVLLRVPVESMEGVFVLPAGAVVREGPEAYVFQQSGDVFLRRPVHVVYEDGSSVVLAEGSVSVGDYVAQNAAAQINRALRAKAGGEGEGHGHEHHHHHHDD